MSFEDAVAGKPLEDELAAVRAELRAANIKLKKAHTKSEAMVEAAFAGAYSAILALGGVPKVKAPQRDLRRKHTAEVAIWDAGDWQGSKVTPSYNSEVMVTRVMQFTDKCELLTNIQRQHHPVKHCVIIFGGDMVEGLFNFPTQPFEIDQTIFGQYVSVGQLLVRVVQRALSIYETVHVVPEWGNHGRIGSHRDTVPKGDNIDRMCYHLARELLKDEPRLTWQECPEDIQRLEVGNYRALVIHGDEVGRTGTASPQTLLSAADRWASGAYDWDFNDIYTHHLHTFRELPLSNGKGALYFNGSTESENRYARDSMAASAKPTQRLNFVDPVKGRVTSVSKIYLD